MILEAIADEVGLSRKQAHAALDAALDNIERALVGDETVTLVGFGTFTVSLRKARTGRNPKTGAAIKIPARNVIRFKPGRRLRIAVG